MSFLRSAGSNSSNPRYLAGYGLKAFLIAQSLNQLEKAYGPNNSILDNCHIRLTYAANDDRTAKRISDLLGQSTEKKVQRSYSGSGLFLSNRTESEQEYGRPLLTPAEVNQLPADDGILLVGGLVPYRARKVRYFLDPRFRGRDALSPPDLPEQQAKELLGAVDNDWDGLVAGASEESFGEPAEIHDSPTSSTSSATSSDAEFANDGEARDHTGSPAGAVEDVWAGLLESFPKRPGHPMAM
jgi:type IV secretory pathway TraG/TraD family ATPase VirD4